MKPNDQWPKWYVTRHAKRVYLHHVYADAQYYAIMVEDFANSSTAESEAETVRELLRAIAPDREWKRKARKR